MDLKIKRLIWYLVYFANWAIILGFWWNGSGGILLDGGASTILALGRLAGLAAAYFILAQVFLMGRTPWLERVFGLDRLSRMHASNGKRGMVILLFHPVLITLAYSRLAGVGFWQQFFSGLSGSNDLLYGFIAFCLLLVVVVTSLVIVRSKLKYENWYYVHIFVYLAIFLAFLHQRNLGTDLLVSKFFYNYWILLYIIVFGMQIVFRFSRVIFNYLRFDFTVDHLVRENPTITSVYITGRDLKRYGAQPGQFNLFRFFRKGMWWQAHPFSVSMTPHDNLLRISVKELGDFTKDVPNIKPGTKLFIDGPYGIFTEKSSSKEKVLMIAGGIGITPIRSLMEQLAMRGKDIVFLNSVKTEADLVFKKELDELLTKFTNVKIVHIVAEDLNWKGESGRIDQNKIKKLVTDVAQREVFLCGPPPMMDALVKALTELGVKENDIHFEKFSLG